MRNLLNNFNNHANPVNNGGHFVLTNLLILGNNVIGGPRGFLFDRSMYRDKRLIV